MKILPKLKLVRACSLPLCMCFYYKSKSNIQIILEALDKYIEYFINQMCTYMRKDI